MSNQGRLCLTRKENESILIKSKSCEIIEVSVYRITGNQVRLIVEAEQEVQILRKELVL